MVDYVDRFDAAFMPKLGIRAPTFRAVLREMLARDHKSIVETGCIRKADNWEGDGQSSIVWADYIKWNHGSYQTMDIDAEACALTRELVPSAAVACGNSLVELTRRDTVIDLLYLDSYDVDMANPHPAALHCLMELTSARPRLRSGSIVFIDDSPMEQGFVVGGKGKYVAEYFKEIGVAPFTFAYQIAWVMP